MNWRAAAALAAMVSTARLVRAAARASMSRPMTRRRSSGRLHRSPAGAAVVAAGGFRYVLQYLGDTAAAPNRLGGAAELSASCATSR